MIRVLGRLSYWLLLAAVAAAAQDVQFGPGVERWEIKTSLLPGALNQKPKAVDLSALKTLSSPSPTLLEMLKQKPDGNIRLRDNSTGLQEGDMVSTTGFIQLVAVEATKKKGSNEATDGDYHIQISDSRDSRDNVVIMEVPRPEFVSDPDLKQKVTQLRDQLRTTLMGGKEFSLNTGTCIGHPMRATLVGQLFYDATHTTKDDPGGGRGKQHHHAATLWELHPLISATFLDPKGGSPAVSCP